MGTPAEVEFRVPIAAKWGRQNQKYCQHPCPGTLVSDGFKRRGSVSETMEHTTASDAGFFYQVPKSLNFPDVVSSSLNCDNNAHLFPKAFSSWTAATKKNTNKEFPLWHIGNEFN